MEQRVGGIVIDRSKADDTTYLGDMDDFRKFKIEVIGRIEKLEKEIEKFKAVKKVEYTK